MQQSSEKSGLKEEKSWDRAKLASLFTEAHADATIFKVCCILLDEVCD